MLALRTTLHTKDAQTYKIVLLHDMGYYNIIGQHVASQPLYGNKSIKQRETLLIDERKRDEQ